MIGYIGGITIGIYDNKKFEFLPSDFESDLLLLKASEIMKNYFPTYLKLC